MPKGRARHAAVVYDEKLFILGGQTGVETYVLDEICFLDLKTWTWSRSWSFVPRYDHSAWVWGGRMWVFGGLGPDMERTNELWWLDLKNNPAFKTIPEYGSFESPQSSIPRATSTARSSFATFNQPQAMATGTTGYIANSRMSQVRAAAKPIAPGAIASMRFMSGPNVPNQALGTHFHVYSSGALLDFVTPAGTIRPSECNLSALELDAFRWQKLAEGPEIFDPGYRWNYCAINEDGTKVWLLGCANDSLENFTGASEAYLSDVLPLDLRRFGLLGNDLISDLSGDNGKVPTSEKHGSPHLSGLGADFAALFDKSPESGSGSDFIITGEKDDETEEDMDLTHSTHDGSGSQQLHGADISKSPPIHVHKLILQARWPHFTRLYAAQMAEFHTKKMHIPEPYTVVRAFLYYLYTDSIARHPEYCPTLAEVAGLLVMANIYDLPRLRLQCVHRLSRGLDIESAAVVWDRAGVAGEDWLRRRAANYCLTHWGRLVRTEGFRRLSPQSMVELCANIDVEGRVVSGEELEVIGGLGGGRLGVTGSGRSMMRGRLAAPGIPINDDMDEIDGEEDDGMELN
jgi:hypothetical protein